MPIVPSRPLSYTAISAYQECAYRFYMERVLGLTSTERSSSRIPGTTAFAPEEATPSAREERTARGAAVHALLEWSQANGWAEPSSELAQRHGEAIKRNADPGDLLAPVRQWISSPLRECIAAEATRTRAEVPLLLGVGGTVLRGSIDLMVEREGAPPLVYLVAPALRFHPSTDVLFRYLSPEIEFVRVGLGEIWRQGLRVAMRQ